MWQMSSVVNKANQNWADVSHRGHSVHILVTGANGFIGRSLVAKLTDAGHAVRVAIRRPASFSQAVDVALIPDLSGPVDWYPILRGIDVVIHLGGLAHADNRKHTSSQYNQINHLATQELALASARAGVKRLIYISSVRAQTGPCANYPLRETDEPLPTDSYGASKLAGEIAVRTAGVPFTIFRPVVVYGEEPKGNFLTVFRLASSPLPLPLAGFKNRRSVLCVDNLVSAILFVMNKSTTIGETYLIADAKPISVNELFTVLRRALGRRPGLVYFPPKLIQLALRLLKRNHVWERLGEELIVDTTKLQSTGWRAEFDTHDSMMTAIRAKSY